MIDAPDVATAQAGYLAAIRTGDRRRAFSVAAEAQLNGLDMGALYLHVLQPSLQEVGRLWQENEMTAAEEHLATAITQMVMARAVAYATDPIARGDRVVIAACAESERHDVGLRMVCDLLEQEGWSALYLGASVPRESLARLVAERQPDAVILSASITPHLPQLQDMIECVREAAGEHTPFIMVGGRPFLDDPALALRLGADATAHDALLAVACLRERFG